MSDVVEHVKAVARKLIDEWPRSTWEDVIIELDAERVSYKPGTQRRWSTNYTGVMKLGDRFVEFTHEEGATENQDDGELEWELDSLREVKPVEVTVIKYVPVD
jgi:hypothetical protein